MVTTTSSELSTEARAGPTRASPARKVRRATTVEITARATIAAQAWRLGGTARPPWPRAQPMHTTALAWARCKATVSDGTPAAKWPLSTT